MTASTPVAIVRSTMIEARVICNTQLTERLYSLRLELPLQSFLAGQFVRLQLTLGDEVVTKSYSIVNAPTDSVLEVFFNTVPNGRLSNALALLKIGDRIEVSQPANGFFTLNEVPSARDLWMIATGTGLGPYLSILRTRQLWETFSHVVLVHGVPLREELVYQDVITAAQVANPAAFQFISCVSRESNPGGLMGRVTTALETGELEQQAGLQISPEHSSVMLCGNHAMIEDMKTLLADRNMYKHLRHKPGHIVTEQYF